MWDRVETAEMHVFRHAAPGMTTAPRPALSATVIDRTGGVSVTVLHDHVERLEVHRKVVFVRSDNGQGDIGGMRGNARNEGNSRHAGCQGTEAHSEREFATHDVNFHRN